MYEMVEEINKQKNFNQATKDFKTWLKEQNFLGSNSSKPWNGLIPTWIWIYS